MDEQATTLAALRDVAQRLAVARRLNATAEQGLLQSVVDAAATLFDAEAASIALYEPDPDRLEFRVAAGAKGAGVIGLSVPLTQGIVGFVFSTGQPLALSDVASDPRFDVATAKRTGYVPRSIAAVPLVSNDAAVGVLQVLDKRSTERFGLRDMELLAVFARQAAAAIEATRVQRDGARLLHSILRELGGADLSEEQVDILVSTAAQQLDQEDGPPFWRLVDLVQRMRDLSEREVSLVTEILEAVARSTERSRKRS
jgi:signal transduction protein with GAF and PtsI domain